MHKSALIIFLVSLMTGLLIEAVDYFGNQALALSKEYERQRVQLVFNSHNAAQGCLESLDDARELILSDAAAMRTTLDKMLWYKIGVGLVSLLLAYGASYISVYLINKHKTLE